MLPNTNFRTYLEPADLEALRRLARHLDMTLTTGQLTGQGSPRRLLIALAQATRAQGVKRVAAELRPLLALTEAEAGTGG